MEFSISKVSLSREIGLLQGVIERKGTIPVLANLLLEAIDGKVKLIATDLDITIQTECAADVAKVGGVLLHARRLFEIVKSMPDADILFSKQENDWVKVACGSAQFRLAGTAVEHFPSIPRAVEPKLRIQAAELSKLISRTIRSIAHEETRFALSGALFEVGGGRARMVSTDGHRLSLAECAAETSEEFKGIIPKKALTEVLRLCSDKEAEIGFSFDENHVFFWAQPRILISRILAGQFPNYELVIPKDNDKILAIDTTDVAKAIERVALIADERSRGIRFDLGEDRLRINSQVADVGEAEEILAVDWDAGSLAIGFNAQYVLDFLGEADSDKVIFELKDGQKPVLIKPANGDQRYIYVVMPMRLM
jgi:DNA polymerase-3 subunit beta